VKIALDATYSVGDEPSGIGVYSREMLCGFARAHPEVQFEFCYRPHAYRAARADSLPPNARRRLLAAPFSPHGVDLFHGLNQRLPRKRFARSVATFHDLFVLTGEYSTPEFRERFTGQARDAASRADAIIAVSEFTKRQVVDVLGVEASRVYVVHHGTTRWPAPAGVLRERFILSVGSIQKRKNTARLVEAFEGVDKSWRLVLAGGEGYGAAEIRERIRRSCASERVMVTGYVSKAELAAWYARASVFAFPSLDEGFGMPVLEAMSAGIPVVTSNRSALPEVAGDAALLVDPEETAALTEALRDLTRNSDLREKLSAKGLKRAGLFTWEQAVQQTWAVYGRVLR